MFQSEEGSRPETSLIWPPEFFQLFVSGEKFIPIPIIFFYKRYVCSFIILGGAFSAVVILPREPIHYGHIMHCILTFHWPTLLLKFYSFFLIQNFCAWILQFLSNIMVLNNYLILSNSSVWRTVLHNCIHYVKTRAVLSSSFFLKKWFKLIHLYFCVCLYSSALNLFFWAFIIADKTVQLFIVLSILLMWLFKLEE